MKRRGRYGYRPRPEEEGIMFEGWWFTAEEMGEICRERMEKFDALPRKDRDRINRKGR